jgi:hypothetical protein
MKKRDRERRLLRCIKGGRRGWGAALEWAEKGNRTGVGGGELLNYDEKNEIEMGRGRGELKCQRLQWSLTHPAPPPSMKFLFIVPMAKSTLVAPKWFCNIKDTHISILA